MDQTEIITIVLVVVVLVSAFQAVQLTTLKAKLESNELSLAKPRVQAASTSGQVSAPSSLENLPQMVGGC